MSRLDRYQNPELYEMLAGEYVLGTMSSRARRRFVQLMEERRYIREAVEVWERRLHPLAGRIEPVQPHHRVWEGIRDELRSHQGQKSGQNSSSGLLRNLLIWRSLAIVASILCAFLVYELLKSPTIPEMPSYVAVLESDNHTPMLVAKAIQQPSMRMVIKMMDESIISPDKDLELWCFMQGSDRVWSMGVLQRSGETVLPLDQESWDMVNESASLAISAEPMGGSPTGRPTGPIMYSGNFVSLI